VECHRFATIPYSEGKSYYYKEENLKKEEDVTA
jgi:hypothetical protein